MRVALGLFLPVAVATAAIWWWLGAPVALPSSPLAGQKYPCVSYAPFRGSQTPFDQAFRVPAAQIEEDLKRLAPVTRCVRTYATNQGLDQVPEIAQRHGLEVLLGVWLGREAERNRAEIAAAVELVRRFPGVIRGVVVGNETLLRGELSAADVASHLRAVKAQVAVPVTYADVWEFWMRNRDLAGAVDFITIHILPYWEDFPIAVDAAPAHVDAIRRHVAEAFPGREILIGEVGWPSAGRMREGALPSPAAQAGFVQDVLARADRGNYRVNLIEAFDQPWKRSLEGTVGGHWGLLDADSRAPKFTLGTPVSNHPHWRWQAAGGIAFAALVFAAALAGARRRKGDAPGLPAWLGTAAIALVSGTLIGWTIANLPLEALGLGGWARSLALAALALAAPLAAAAALTRGAALPSFAEVLGAAGERSRDPLALLLGLLLVGLTVVALEIVLALVFNPRYRDFYFAPLTAAVAPFLVLSLHAARRGTRPLAETVAAAAFAGSAGYIVPNESLANWQSLWSCAAILALAFILSRARDARGSGS
ncbi:MAG: beta-(1-6) glucans synthase [Xanthobacteraceae bacterium]|nr:beta-(1-6) glucans synthase [Xanthobacteraceae bacterium]